MFVRFVCVAALPCRWSKYLANSFLLLLSVAPLARSLGCRIEGATDGRTIDQNISFLPSVGLSVGRSVDRVSDGRNESDETNVRYLVVGVACCSYTFNFNTYCAIPFNVKHRHGFRVMRVSE